MDARLSLSEELRDRSGDVHCDFFEIEEFTFGQEPFHVNYILNEFWKEVHQEDMSEWVDKKIQGHEITIQKIELALYKYMYQGFKVYTARMSDGLVLGVIVGMAPLYGTLSIKALYVLPDLRNTNIAKKLVNSFVDTNVLFFQTLRENSPELMFSKLKNEPVKLSEDDKIITWSMKWES